MARRLIPTTNVEAVEVALKKLALNSEHAALEQAARSLALAVDTVPGESQLWREYRQVLEMLARVGAGGDDDGSTAFLISVQTPGVRAKVRNSAKS